MRSEQDWFRELGAGYASETLDGQPTFLGVLRKRFYDPGNGEAISAPWRAESTRIAYLRDYNRRLIPALGNGIALSSMTEDDFVRSLAGLKETYPILDVNHYRNLIWRVYKAGVDDGLYADSLHWDRADLSPSQGKAFHKSQRQRMTLKRSLSIQEEDKIIRLFKSFDVTNPDGRLIGIFLMFFLGLRNNEAAGARFGNIKTLSTKEEPFPCLIVSESTEIDNNLRRIGGKTVNAFRSLPLFPFLFEFLEKRKQHLQSLVDSGSLVLNDGDTVDSLPIANRPTGYANHSGARDLSEVGRQLFQDLGIGRYAQELLKEDIINQQIDGEQSNEKDPTTYLLRRNFLTHLTLLGMSDEEVEYCIGHSIEDASLTRNMLSSEEAQKRIYHSLLHHPYMLFFSPLRQFSPTVIRLHLEPGETIRGRIVSMEPGNTVSISGMDRVHGELTIRPVFPDVLHEEIQIQSKVAEVYWKYIKEGC